MMWASRTKKKKVLLFHDFTGLGSMLWLFAHLLKPEINREGVEIVLLLELGADWVGRTLIHQLFQLPLHLRQSFLQKVTGKNS